MLMAGSVYSKHFLTECFNWKTLAGSMLIVHVKCFCFTQDPKAIVSFISDTEFLLEIGGSGKQLRKKQLLSFSVSSGKFIQHLVVYAKKPSLGEKDSTIPNL